MVLVAGCRHFVHGMVEHLLQHPHHIFDMQLSLLAGCKNRNREIKKSVIPLLHYGDFSKEVSKIGFTN